jgi:hypothetical protein
MFQRACLLLLVVVGLSGCAPSAEEKLKQAERDLERAESRLDSLRPAYDEARKTAENAVCKEIAGVTVEESANAALAGLGNVLNQTAVPAPAEGAAPADGKAPSGKKVSDIDATIDNLIAAQQDVQQKQATLTAPLAKANETMGKIRTPGTPENKKFEEKFSAMPEVQAYERQLKRVEKAKEALEEAKAE